MNEKEKMALISQVLARNIEGGHTDKFSTVEINSNFENKMYSKETFEDNVIEGLNDKIDLEDVVTY
jgi:hypothetical protein